MKKSEIITDDLAGKTVYHVLRYHMGMSGKLLKKLRDAGLIYVNNTPVRTTFIVDLGDIVGFDESALNENSDYISAEDTSLDIIYEDDYFIAINKPSNIVVHPTALHQQHTIANGLVYYYQKNNIQAKIHPISRLDRDTTGVILFAKDKYTVHLVSNIQRTHGFQKEYLGIVAGSVIPNAGIIDLPIARMADTIMLRHITCAGQPSRTYYRTLLESSGKSLLLLYPLTGRTHQLRVHLAALGHPLLGDGLYHPGYAAASSACVRQPEMPPEQAQLAKEDEAEWQQTEQEQLTLSKPTQGQMVQGSETSEQPALDQISLDRETPVLSAQGQLLHSHRLTFCHPHSLQNITIEAPLPVRFMQELRTFRVPDLN